VHVRQGTSCHPITHQPPTPTHPQRHPQQASTLFSLLTSLPAPAGADAHAHAAAVAAATGALTSIQEAAAKLRAELAEYLSYAVLRERALATLARSSGASGAAAPAVDPKEPVALPLVDIEPDSECLFVVVWGEGGEG